MLRILLTLVMLMSMATPVFAFERTSVSLGKPTEMFDWPQGLVVNGNVYYVMDGTTIKQIEYGKIKTNYSLFKLKPLLPAKLRTDEVIRSFRLANMEYWKGKIVVSGLLFLNLEDEEIYVIDPARKHSGAKEKVLGHTYTVLFEIEKGKAKILRLSLSKVNKKLPPDTFFETDSGLPEDLYQWGNYTLLNYAAYVTYPHFTITTDGTIVYIRQQDKGDDPQPAYPRQIVALKNGKEKVLYSWKDSSISSKFFEGNEVGNWAHFVLPVLRGSTLDIYDGTVFIHHINLLTNEIKTEEGSIDYLLERPLYRNGKVYFLNDQGVFTIQKVMKNNRVLWDYKFIFNDVENSGIKYVTGYDYDGKYLYVIDSYNRQIHKIKP